VQRSVLLDAHRAHSARLSAGDPPRLLTYGKVPEEYRAAIEAAVLFDETDRGCLAVRGPDAAAFLHRLLANDVRGLAPGVGNRNLLLSPKGKVLEDFDLAPEASGHTGGAFLLSTPPGRAAALAERLDTYLFADQVELVDLTGEHAPLALSGPAAARVVHAVLGVDPPARPHAPLEVAFEGARGRLAGLPVAGSPGWRVDLGPRAAPRLWAALAAAGATPAGIVVRDILRVEAGRALWGEDVDESVYPQEARMQDAFSLEKGCYIGQEVVAKIDTYGGLNKRLCGLSVDSDEPVARGTRLYREDGGEWRDLGLVTSWAYSFALDTGLVLAYLKRRHQEAGTEFRVGEGPLRARVVELPVRAGALPLTGAE